MTLNKIALIIGIVMGIIVITMQEAKSENTSASCPQTKRWVIKHRAETWNWQDKLGIRRASSSHAERWTKSCAYLKWVNKKWSHRAAKFKQTYFLLTHNPYMAIRHVFGPYHQQALSVARCESRLTTTAQNGQYLGLFQMGESERGLFGHGSDALTQTRAAYRYFILSGRDWSPWECKP